MFAKVIVDISNSEVDKVFDYDLADYDLQPGFRVLVPFGKTEVEGYIISIAEKSDCPKEKIKKIIRPIDDVPVIGEEFIALIDFMRNKYHLRIVDILRLFIPAQMRGGHVKELKKKYASINPKYLNEPIGGFIKSSATAQKELFEYLKKVDTASVTELNENFSASALRNLVARNIVLLKEMQIRRTPYSNATEGSREEVTLSDDQQNAVNAILNSPQKRFLLFGVTGSGKTEVYIKAISKAVEQGKTAIMLVPEISLTPQVLRTFRLRFGNKVALLHSGLSIGERFDEWQRLLSGDAVIAVGARSAVFAPLKNVGIIIIDEEHDSSYNSESNPRYFTSEVAEFRQSYNDCKLVYGSATPSIESFYRAEIGELKLLEMPKRVKSRPLPNIEIINMCEELYNGNNGVFSNKLREELYNCIGSGNQAIIFINRRGYSSFVMCKQCGYVAKCEACDVSLVYHRDENVLKCHYCNNRYSMLDVCPNCGSEHIKQGYVGTQKVAETLQNMFPNEKILRMDNDTTQRKDSHLKILSEFASGKARILVGTQMVAKGHDFPDVTLVGIVDADMSLHFADYRSAERTFQLITQVSGRAGRDNKPGKVILQTYSPNHYVYRYAISNDYLDFYKKELNLREVTKYPPFSKVVRILVQSEDEQKALDNLKKIYDGVNLFASANPKNFAFLSAMKSPVKRIQLKFRVQILMRIVRNTEETLAAVYKAIDDNVDKRVSCFVEINPNSLY